MDVRSARLIFRRPMAARPCRSSNVCSCEGFGCRPHEGPDREFGLVRGVGGSSELNPATLVTPTARSATTKSVPDNDRARPERTDRNHRPTAAYWPRQ
jgi:hypothetical protein